MRALLSRGVRPCVGPVSPSTRTIPNLPARKAGFAALPKQLTFCDAFTILLAPVLTTAFVVETTRKERRKQAWDQKIAEVQAATEALRQREAEAWARLQNCSIRHGLSHQRRLYSTAASPVLKVVDEDDVGLRDETADERAEANCEIELRDESRPAVRPSSTADIELQQEWARLISLRLALQMLIHLRVGESRYNKSLHNLTLDPNHFPRGTDELIERLRMVKEYMRHVARKAIPFESSGQSQRSATRATLNVEVDELAKAFRFRQISLPELVIKYCNAIAVSPESPSTQSLRDLMQSLNAMNHHKMASYVAGAIWDGAQLLSDTDVSGMLSFYSEHKDTTRIQKFLDRLVKQDSFPRSKTKWKMAKLSGKLLPVPNTAQQTSLQSTFEQLIRSSLRCNQRSIAQAYTVCLNRTPHMSYGSMFVNSCFLHNDAAHADWTRGKIWLRKAKIAVACAVANGTSEQELGVAILRMLDFCVACDQLQEYKDILYAAISAGFELPSLDRTQISKFRARSRDIRQDWRKQKYSATTRGAEWTTLSAKAIHFQQVLAQRDPTITSYIGVEDPQHLADLVRDQPITSAPAGVKKNAIVRPLQEEVGHKRNSQTAGNESKAPPVHAVVSPPSQCIATEDAADQFAKPFDTEVEATIDDEDEGYCTDSTTGSRVIWHTTDEKLSTQNQKRSLRIGIAISPPEDWSNTFGTDRAEYAVE